MVGKRLDLPGTFNLLPHCRDWNAQPGSSYQGLAGTDPGGDIEVSYR